MSKMGETGLKNMTDVCTGCPYLRQYLDGLIDVEEARRNCGYRCQGFANREFIYKFDVVLSVYRQQQRKNFKGHGRQPVAEKRYGKAARALQADGKSVADIAQILNLSRPTVYKLLHGDGEQAKGV